MMTVFITHPSDRTWKVFEYGMDWLANPERYHDEDQDNYIDRMTAFNSYQILTAATLGQIDILSEATYSVRNGITTIDQIDDRAYVLLKSFWEGVKILALAYPEYFEVKDE